MQSAEGEREREKREREKERGKLIKREREKGEREKRRALIDWTKTLGSSLELLKSDSVRLS